MPGGAHQGTRSGNFLFAATVDDLEDNTETGNEQQQITPEHDRRRAQESGDEVESCPTTRWQGAEPGPESEVSELGLTDQGERISRERDGEDSFVKKCTRMPRMV